MAGPLLLVHDDIAGIAAIRRLLAREGYEVILATSAADAMIAFGHHFPALIILSPSVEGNRGRIILEELSQHPEGRQAKVLLLGESIPGFGAPVVPLPLDGGTFLKLVSDTLEGGTGETWEVYETQDGELPTVRPPDEPEAWAVGPAANEPQPSRLASTDWERAAMPAEERERHDQSVRAQQQQREEALERARREVAAEAIAAIDAQEDHEGSHPGLVDDLPPDLSSGELAVPDPAYVSDSDIVHDEPEPLVLVEAPGEEAAPSEDPLDDEWLPPEPDSAVFEAPKFDEEPAVTAEHPIPEAAEETQSPAEGEQAALSEQTFQDAAERAASGEAGTGLPFEKSPWAQSKEDAELLLSTLTERARELEAQADEARARAEALARRTGVAYNVVSRAMQAANELQSEAQAQLALKQREAEQARWAAEQVKAEAAQALARAEDQAQRAVVAAQQKAEEAAAVARAEREERTRLESQLEHFREVAEQERRAAEAEARRVEQALHAAEEAASRAQSEALAFQQRAEQDEAQEKALLERTAKLREHAERLAVQLEEAKAAARVAEDEAQTARRLAADAEAKAEAQAQRVRQEHARTAALETPGRAELGVAGAGQVSLEQLAPLVVKLCSMRASLKLELRTPEATRALWLSRGQLIAAASSVPHESLLDQARRDGLIDGRQESELRHVRGTSSQELLQVLRTRGYLRDNEVVPLLQRHGEAIALEALSEPQSLYRLTEQSPEDVQRVSSTRPLLQLVVEALRRSVDAWAVIEGAGGVAAIPSLENSELDWRELGFGERERRLLSMVDGTQPLDQLFLSTGLRQEPGVRAVAVACLLGVLKLEPPEVVIPAPSSDLDVQRLEAKYEQLQEADYFSVLGLPRNAGSEEVQRAFETLSAEFSPLKFVGHPDATVRRRAQEIYDLLSEAAGALQDDRLRSAYARHLID